MKKSLVSALTTALVVGAASTTFAAANPFEDVPADHWAYDAIAQLAADGVIEGYGDGTYRGDQAITRYEMAQMVARAMAKGNGVDKAMIDKLAAEFADELNSLGVRVTALEKKVDNVKWYGLFRYTYAREREENDMHNHRNTNDLRIRLSMTANINEHWTGNGRIEYIGDMADAINTTGQSHAGTDIRVNRAWVEGKYSSTMIQLGKFPAFTDVDNGMVYDADLAGGLVKFGNKANVKLMAARVGNDNHAFGFERGVNVGTASYQSIEINSDPNQKFTVGAAYHHFSTKDLNLIGDPDNVPGRTYNADALNIWEIGMGYRFDNNVKLAGAYAKNTSGDFETKHRQAWNLELDYKGVDSSTPGSWGAFLAYRHLGNYGVIAPTYNTMWNDKKGFNCGLQYTPIKNVVTIFEYYTGKRITTDRKQNTIFARVEMYF
ncbi:MAG: S-layer homology domain-containing protein [Schwartzia sp.]|nr:S-layer homology domain-containing protein [Schwartzia sp. (in: firmicutes)]